MRISYLEELIILQGGRSGGLVGLLPILVFLALILIAVALMKRGGSRQAAVEGAAVVAGESTALVKRYRDAYLVARATATIGKVIKGVGIVVAAYGLATGVAVALQSESTGVGLVIVLLPTFAGALLYCVGVLVAAQGQILLATLDTAVHSSPFLANEDKAKAMFL